MKYTVNSIGEYIPYTDEHGNPVKRTPETHPYSFDGYVTYKSEGKANGTVYSDRLNQWAYEKNERLKKIHFGNTGDYFDSRSPEKIQSYLREYLDKPNLELVMIMKYCNHSNGYPVWRFDYNTNEK